ncbi:MAG: 16S rRNA (adenine(1518)-N(6)/adenine(1519)-N(6))-dimethyltransferase RsmA [Lachnoclostridium sp.]|jgi:16S rRNA (adenine1518-N6/adenine1519-N6)-dimethyltransferase|nr:16S rRNA (adenine(1518)-N(6)/adenine(1519)-N(6))-dimethyltransferase RsmA [Lachnoclostridium sp.]
MIKLTNPSETIAVIKKYDFHFKKKYGQNFLVDSHMPDKIIQAAGITKDDFILEIGPGIGTMTQYLCEKAGNVLAVEIDQKCVEILKETLADYNNANILCGDILKQDIHSLTEKYNAGKPLKVVANLPYYITTPIIMKLFESRIPMKSVTVMVQKEVAERMNARPGNKSYGALSLAVQYYAEPFLIASVPPSCFIPRPDVSSSVICLECFAEPPVDVKDEKLMFRIIRASFNQRRKTLINALSNSGEFSVTKKEIGEILESLCIERTIRGEKLSLAQFAALSNQMRKR